MSQTPLPLPLNQLAFTVIDLRVTERWWRAVGFLPAGGNGWLFRGPPFWAIQGIVGVSSTVWWMVGRDDWSQIEMWQYDSPTSKLMRADAAPNDLGYTRIGVWVADLDVVLVRLARLGTSPLAEPLGIRGKRRVCMRNPDGVFIELMEDDLRTDVAKVMLPDCGAALRSITLSTPDIAQAEEFFGKGLGMQAWHGNLHEDAHEALWGLAGAQCERRVFATPSSNILLEVVEYMNPRGRPRPEGYRLCDQGILNFAFGDPRSYRGVHGMLRRAKAAGAKAHSFPIHIPIAGVVYVADPQGHSVEFMWANQGLGRQLYGFNAMPEKQRPSCDNHRLDFSAVIPASPAEVFAAITQPGRLNDWQSLGVFSEMPGKSATGYGGERYVRTAAGRLREQVVEWSPDESYRYRIISFSPFIGYQGEARLTVVEGGTRVDWSIRFRPRFPGTGALLTRILSRGMLKSLRKLQIISARAVMPEPTVSIHTEKTIVTKIIRFVLINVLASIAIMAVGHLLSYLFG
jgi:catechol 2,3-dioxygenase-like lactoylglutathione lyase family enzyme/uncharacterized protein YndB with AHSA1/START domain